MSNKCNLKQLLYYTDRAELPQPKLQEIARSLIADYQSIPEEEREDWIAIIAVDSRQLVSFSILRQSILPMLDRNPDIKAYSPASDVLYRLLH